MQELRFVGVEQGAVIATSEDGTRYRLVIDEALRDALRTRPTVSRSEGPKVPPRIIQQMIRAGRTVDEVVADTGADRELVARFEGPILAERGYLVEQARAVAVRVQQPLDPLSSEEATFGTAIDERLEQLAARDVRWDAWRDPETGWHVGLDFVTDDVTRNALWRFDAKSHTLEALSPAAITLSQQGELPPLGGPHLRAVEVHRTEAVIPVDEPAPMPDPFAAAELQRSTTNETADLLEALRRRRGERSTDPYQEEAEFGEDDLDLAFAAGPSADLPEARTATVTPFARLAADSAQSFERGGAASEPAEDAGADEARTDAVQADDVQADAAQDDAASIDPARADARRGATGPAGSASVRADRTGRDDRTGRAEQSDRDDRRSGRSERTSGAVRAVDVPLSGLESEVADAEAKPARRGRMSMPSWDEIVFGTRSDDDK